MADRVYYCTRLWLPIYFGFCPSEAAWDHEVKRLKIKPTPAYPTTDANTTLFESKNRLPLALVTVNHKFKSRIRRGEADAVALIAHEAVHVWQEVLSHVGEQKASQELEAYGVQCIFTGLYHACLLKWFPKHRGLAD